VCIIELQAGEKILGEPHIGDSVRWNISPAMYGMGDQATAIIILKPQTPGLDTNLLITTDRRAYYLRLISKPEDSVARVAFAYPEDDNRKWQQQVAAQQALAKQEKHAAEVSPAVIAVEKVITRSAVEMSTSGLSVSSTMAQRPLSRCLPSFSIGKRRCYLS
jgi:type IV secretion system protein VirB9